MLINRNIFVPKTGFYLLLSDMIFSPAPPEIIEEFNRTGIIEPVNKYLEPYNLNNLYKNSVANRVSATEIVIPKNVIITCDNIDSSTTRFLVSISYNREFITNSLYCGFHIHHGTPFDLNAYFIERSERNQINSTRKKQELIDKIERGDI